MEEEEEDGSSGICDMSGGIWEVVVGTGRMGMDAGLAATVFAAVDADDDGGTDLSPSFSSPNRPIFAGN